MSSSPFDRLLDGIHTQDDLYERIQNIHTPASIAAESTTFLADIARSSSATEVARVLHAYVKAFEAGLKESEEVGVRLVSFGQSVVFHVQALKPEGPCLITFAGVTDDKKPICLIQHVSQLSFVLMALPKLDPDKPKRRYGFGPPDPTAAPAAEPRPNG